MDEAKITLSSRLSQQLKELSVQEKISPEDVLEAALLTFRQARQAKQLACKAQVLLSGPMCVLLWHVGPMTADTCSIVQKCTILDWVRFWTGQGSAIECDSHVSLWSVNG